MRYAYSCAHAHVCVCVCVCVRVRVGTGGAYDVCALAALGSPLDDGRPLSFERHVIRHGDLERAEPQHAGVRVGDTQVNCMLARAIGRWAGRFTVRLVRRDRLDCHGADEKGERQPHGGRERLRA